MTRPVRRSALIALPLLAALCAAPAALAGGYPPTVRSDGVETAGYARYAGRGWSGESRWSDERVHADDRDGAAVGYLPASFFADAGGVGPSGIDYGYGGFVYASGGASAFAGAHVSASASVSVSVGGGFHGHGGGFRHGCGCR
jgi:hypothetical protein